MWRLIPGQSLRSREWNGEVVLYNDVSGSTHLLDGAALDLLQALQAAPGDAPTLAARLAGRFDLEGAALVAAIVDLLVALADFDLIEPC